MRLERLQEAETNYFITAQLLLKLANRAQDIFVGSEVEQKRLLIKTVLSNLKITNGKLDYELRSPFETIAKCADHSEWRPIQTGFAEQAIPFKHTLSSMQMIFAELGMEVTKGQSFGVRDNAV